MSPRASAHVLLSGKGPREGVAHPFSRWLTQDEIPISPGLQVIGLEGAGHLVLCNKL